jgi:outer membrane biosynthesis protein TonB
LDLQTPDLQIRDEGVPVDDLISRVPPISASPTPEGQPSPNASPTPRPDSESPTANNPAPSPTLTEEQQQLLAFNAEGMDDAAAQDTYAAWFGPLVEELGEDWNGENAPQIPLAAVYPEAACATKTEGVAVVGVLTNDEGEVLEEPEPTLIRSSGIPLFNQAALELAASINLEATGKQQPYLLNIEFNYDAEACSAEPQGESQTEN